MIDFRRRGVIKNLLDALLITEAELIDHIQTQMAPTVVSDCAVSLDDVPTEDLREAMRAICGR